MSDSLRQRLMDDPFAMRLIRNLKWIFSSQFAIALLGMITLAVSARALGAAGLGAIALIEAFSRIVARLVHLEPWQAVIHHGTVARETDDKDRFAGLVGLSITLDLLGGVLAGVVMLIAIPLLGPILGLDGPNSKFLVFGALAIFFSLRATGIALMRLYDRFDTLAKIDTATAAVRALLAVTAYLLGGGIGAFVAIFVIFSLIEGTAAFWFGWREMKKDNQHVTFANTRNSLNQNPGFLRLMWNSNLAVILRQTTQRLDVMILAALLPQVAVGYYHIARRCGETALRLGRPIRQAIYPEMARFAARGEYGRIGKIARGITTSFAAALLITLVPIIWFIEPILSVLFGPDFVAASTVVSIQAIAVSSTLAGVVLGPILLSLEKDRGLMWTGVLTASLFFALIVPLVSAFGVNGAAITHLICNLTWLISCTIMVRRALAEKREGDLIESARA